MNFRIFEVKSINFLTCKLCVVLQNSSLTCHALNESKYDVSAIKTQFTVQLSSPDLEASDSTEMKKSLIVHPFNFAQIIHGYEL